MWHRNRVHILPSRLPLQSCSILLESHGVFRCPSMRAEGIALMKFTFVAAAKLITLRSFQSAENRHDHRRYLDESQGPTSISASSSITETPSHSQPIFAAYYAKCTRTIRWLSSGPLFKTRRLSTHDAATLSAPSKSLIKALEVEC